MKIISIFRDVMNTKTIKCHDYKNYRLRSRYEGKSSNRVMSSCKSSLSICRRVDFITVCMKQSKSKHQECSTHEEIIYEKVSSQENISLYSCNCPAHIKNFSRKVTELSDWNIIRYWQCIWVHIKLQITIRTILHTELQITKQKAKLTAILCRQEYCKW